jgi:hypothetical protein
MPEQVKESQFILSSKLELKFGGIQSIHLFKYNKIYELLLIFYCGTQYMKPGLPPPPPHPPPTKIRN